MSMIKQTELRMQLDLHKKESNIMVNMACRQGLHHSGIWKTCVIILNNRCKQYFHLHTSFRFVDHDQASN